MYNVDFQGLAPNGGPQPFFQIIVGQDKAPKKEKHISQTNEQEVVIGHFTEQFDTGKKLQVDEKGGRLKHQPIAQSEKAQAPGPQLLGLGVKEVGNTTPNTHIAKPREQIKHPFVGFGKIACDKIGPIVQYEIHIKWLTNKDDQSYQQKYRSRPTFNKMKTAVEEDN